MARLGSVPDPVCRLSQTPQEDVFSISVSPENVHSFAVLQPQENNQAGWARILLARLAKCCMQMQVPTNKSGGAACISIPDGVGRLDGRMGPFCGL